MIKVQIQEAMQTQMGKTNKIYARKYHSKPLKTNEKYKCLQRPDKNKASSIMEKHLNDSIYLIRSYTG